MNGWMVLALLIAGLATGLRFIAGVRGAALQLALAAMMIGATGYAIQGRPALPGAPGKEAPRAPPLPLTEPRQAMMGQFTRGETWMRIADSLAARGETGEAVGAIRAGIRAHPDDASLWVGLGNALVDHARMATPASGLAFARARQLAPDHPAPLFFQGLAMARTGDADGALALWRQALALTPQGVSYRPMIASGVAALEERKQAGAGK